MIVIPNNNEIKNNTKGLQIKSNILFGTIQIISQNILFCNLQLHRIHTFVFTKQYSNHKLSI